MGNFENVIIWLRKNWYGAIVAYVIAFGIVFLGIWLIIEPFGISDTIENPPDFITKKRISYHLILALITTAHIIIILLVIELNFFKDDSVKNFDIKIQHPPNGDEVKSPFRVSGSYKIKPPDGTVRLLERSLVTLDYWIKNEVVFNETTKQWIVENLYIGGESGEKREIIIAYFGTDGLSLASYYEKANPNPKGKTGIKQLTSDIQTCDQITIKRKI